MPLLDLPQIAPDFKPATRRRIYKLATVGVLALVAHGVLSGDEADLLLLLAAGALDVARRNVPADEDLSLGELLRGRLRMGEKVTDLDETHSCTVWGCPKCHPYGRKG